MLKKKKNKKKYYGKYPFLNMLATEFLFWTIRIRENQLIRKNKKKSKQREQKVSLTNTEQTQKNLQKFLDQGIEKLNLGGGSKNLEGYVNIDFVRHNHVEREVIANILDLSFIPDNSFTQIHSNHVVEHLTEHQFIYHLVEYKRILKDNGIITIRCPNVLGVSYGFFHDAIPETGHKDFLQLGYPKDEDFYNPLDNWYYQDIYGWFHWVYGDVGNIENQHLNLLTPTKIKKILENNKYHILKITDPEASNIIVIARP